MNTTTITINWNDYEGYSEAIRTVASSTLNTFERESDNFKVVVQSATIRYTPEKQREVMEFFGCVVYKPKRNRLTSDRLCWIRYLIWRYCYSKFELTHDEISKVSSNGRSAVTCGLIKIQELLEFNDIRQLRDEVYAKCDEFFK